MAAMEKRGKLWTLAGILVFLLLNYPVLQIFNRDTILAGIPVLALYFNIVWILAIIGLYALGSRLTSRD